MFYIFFSFLIHKRKYIIALQLMDKSSVRGGINAMIFTLHGPSDGQKFQIGKINYLIV